MLALQTVASIFVSKVDLVTIARSPEEYEGFGTTMKTLICGEHQEGVVFFVLF